MTSKEKVLTAYPDAELVRWVDGARAIHVPSMRKYIGWGQEKFNVSSTRAAQQAWDDAASKLPSAPSPAGETASEPTCKWCKQIEDHHTLDVIEGRTVRFCDASEQHTFSPAASEPVSTEGAAGVAATSHVVKNKSTKEGREFWNHVESIAAQPAAPIAPAAVSLEKVWRHLVKRMYDECGAMKADDFIRRVEAGEHDAPGPWNLAKPSAEGDGWIAIARTALEQIADPENPGITPMCECGHDTDDCCVLANYYCPQCIAGRALRLLPAPPSGQGEVK